MHPTAIPVITAEQTADILQHIDVREAMRRVFTSLARGHAVQPAQKVVLLPNNRGISLTTLAWTCPASCSERKFRLTW